MRCYAGGLTGEVVEELVKNCADMDTLNKNGLTAMEKARKGIAQGPSEWQGLHSLPGARSITWAVSRCFHVSHVFMFPDLTQTCHQLVF